MNQTEVDRRKQRGRDIAERFEIKAHGDHFVVPSSKPKGRPHRVVYTATDRSCTCPDHASTGEPCKHVYAVMFFVDGSPALDGAGKRISAKTTYGQNWRVYNSVQVNEDDLFCQLLSDVCSTLTEPERGRGRPRIPLCDAVFAAVFKVYLTKSARRSMTAIRRAGSARYLEVVPAFNTILGVFERPEAFELLRGLIRKTSLPLAMIETDFGVDSTGFAGSRFTRWYDNKYRGTPERVWTKLHMMCGLKTRIVTDVEIGSQNASDTVMLPRLLKTTASSFVVKRVMADKAYNSYRNHKAIHAVGAEAFIPFKSNHTGRRGGPFAKSFRSYQDDPESFYDAYHLRSHVEAAFMQIKTKFGDSVRAKTTLAMKNEVLAKILCHNLCVLISEFYERGVQIGFDGPTPDELAA